MLEVVFGMLALLASGSYMTGLLDTLPIAATLGPFRDLVAAALAVPGLLMILHGCYRMLRSSGRVPRFWLRSVGLASVILAAWAGVTFTGPLLVSTLNAATVAGLPLGYYAVAAVAPSLLVMLLFIYARRQETIEIDEEVAAEEDAWRAI